jgi:hypothetical protein
MDSGPMEWRLSLVQIAQRDLSGEGKESAGTEMNITANERRLFLAIIKAAAPHRCRTIRNSGWTEFREFMATEAAHFGCRLNLFCTLRARFFRSCRTQLVHYGQGAGWAFLS